MNERFKELAEQAYKDVNTNTPSFLVTKEMVDARFAELIVQECLGACYKQAAYWESEYADTYNDGVWSCISGIKEHFGVEE